ncbi:MAG: SDR family oxidoreductase [Acidobacteriota bacterium]
MSTDPSAIAPPQHFREDLLAGETVLITGGGTGLGRAMAERCAAHGAKVAIFGRREEPLRETVDAVRAAGVQAAATTCDIREAAAVEQAVDQLEEEIGPITALVNNAAGNFIALSETLSRNAFDAVVRIVLYGSWNATQALGTRWIERKSGGQVLSILTTYAWTGSPFVLPSACAKAGVMAMTRSLAIEWATYGIRLNGIAPGPFPTEGAFSRLVPPGFLEQARLKHPLQRFGEPQELAGLAAFMLSPAGGYLNGEVITLDGGEWLKHGQEFSAYTDIPREQLAQQMAKMKPPKG